MTWPTDRPGYPMHAERDGWHWLQVSDWHPHAEEWSAARREWKGYHGNGAFDVREGMRALIRYLGPCYTQAEIDAAVQAEREACADVAYGIYDDRMTVGEEETAQGAYDAAISIQARGPTPALTAALAQARREVWEKAAVIAAERGAWASNDADAESLVDRLEANGRMEMAAETAAAIREAAGEEGK